MNDKIKTIIADDHRLFLEGLMLVLARHEKIEVCATASNGSQLIEALQKDDYGMIITDLDMPGMRGEDLIRKIKILYPQTPLLVITMHDEKEIVKSMLRAEADGYVLKNSGRSVFFDAVDSLLDGKLYYDQQVLKLMGETRLDTLLHGNDKGDTLLSKREVEILNLIAREMTSEDIAQTLFISKRTVDTHRFNMLQKTGAKTIIGLVKYGLVHHLIKL